MNKVYIIVLTITISIIALLLYNKLAFLNIVIKFDELEPFEKQMNVYYKGFKIGKTVKIYPDKEYLNTYIKLKIHPHNINLPENITAKIQSSKKGRYVNILYPDAPSLKRIKNYDEIKGKLAKDITSLMNDDGFAEIISNTTTLVESAIVTVQNLGDIFNQINSILIETRGNIILASENLAKTTTNLENLTSNLNKSFDENTMKSSIKNIEESTQNINKITTQLDSTTIPIINSTLCETNCTIKNVKEITSGIKNTLKKSFGLGRLLFGKPMRNSCE